MNHRICANALLHPWRYYHHRSDSFLRNTSRYSTTIAPKSNSRKPELDDATVIATTDEGVHIFHARDASKVPSSASLHGLVWGSVLWPSGIALAKYLHHSIRTTQNSTNDATPSKSTTSTTTTNIFDSFPWLSSSSNRRRPLRVLELGCGTGVVGLTLASAASDASSRSTTRAQHSNTTPIIHLTLTDFESALWPLLRQSIDANHLTLSSDTRKGNLSVMEPMTMLHELDWKDPSTFLLNQEWDLVIAADVLYSSMDKLFARALASHLHLASSLSAVEKDTTTTVGLVASPFRKDSPLLGFLEACDRLGLSTERLQDKHGQAVGSYTGTASRESYRIVEFVPIDSNSRQQDVSQSPTFSSHNAKQVQIFRVRRISGCPSEAASIRRASRI